MNTFSKSLLSLSAFIAALSLGVIAYSALQFSAASLSVAQTLGSTRGTIGVILGGEISLQHDGKLNVSHDGQLTVSHE